MWCASNVDGAVTVVGGLCAPAGVVDMAGYVLEMCRVNEHGGVGRWSLALVNILLVVTGSSSSSSLPLFIRAVRHPSGWAS